MTTEHHKMSFLEAAAAASLKDIKHDALRYFRPMEHQKPIFEMPRPKYMLVDGGNRAGKTLSLTALVSAIIRDEPITVGNKKVHLRFPKQKGRPLAVWFVCIDTRHIGNVIYKNFFAPGAFKVVKDPKTGKMRSYKPDEDSKLGLDPKDAPPFIPARYIDRFSWESKADRIFNRVDVKNPQTGELLAEIHAYTSKSSPPQGSPVDLVFIDEQLARDGFIDELKARLVDRDGQLVWSSWCDEDSPELAKFSSMINREIESKSGVAKKITLTMSGNEYLGKKEISDFLAGCATEEERLARDLGIMPGEKLRMYPLFSKDIHTAIIEEEDYIDEVSRELEKTDGIVPRDWTKYLILDPGTQNPAVLLCAVPPPELGEYYIAYQEIYPGRMDAVQLAQEVKKHTHGQGFYKFICDYRAGRQKAMGMSMRIVDAYQNAFKQAGIRCHASGSIFSFASDDVGGRQLALQSTMHIGKRGLPKLRIVTHRCKQLCDQLKKIKKDITRKEVQDERKAPGNPHDLVDCLEYFIASRPRYVEYNNNIEEHSAAYQRFLKRQKKADRIDAIQMGTFY